MAGVAVGLAIVCARPGWRLLRMRIDGWQRPRILPRHIVLVVGLVLGIAGRMVSLPHLILLVGAAFIAHRVARGVRAHRARAARERTWVRCLEIIEVLAGDLRSGAAPVLALERLAGDFEEVRPLQETARNGGDVAHAWQVLARRPGAEGCRWVAAAWAVAEQSGAPLAATLDHVANDLRREQETHRDVKAAVAPARSTATLMAVLPVIALSMGSGLGGSPLTVITTTVPGALLVTAGTVLAALGVAWVDRIAERVETR